MGPKPPTVCELLTEASPAIVVPASRFASPAKLLTVLEARKLLSFSLIVEFSTSQAPTVPPSSAMIASMVLSRTVEGRLPAGTGPGVAH